ncbi:Biopolymer transport protein ExbD [Rosistilla ulvae]|uniref:Biopolymer transport protein ExbD n=1 Tax=Rosistilla ulvae TaxID=1930277 RepID=A0A517LU96_9BACT|nr:biopolymer transporter ExbD [Rosistilla ulvae]QDS86202.1 Biopolymer transport protein ExbD [Rosistilla ulvae]
MAVQLKKSQATSTLSLTPLIDVVFLLLIFFLVASRFAQEDRRIPIELPSATSATPMTEQPKEIVVDIDSEGALVLNGNTVTADELEAELVRGVASNPVHQSVVIRADRRVQFQAVVTVMDLCNRTGVADYTVTTQEGPGEY